MSVPANFEQVVLNSCPLKAVNYSWGQSDSTFKVESIDFVDSSVRDGEVVVQLVYLSNDPAQRGWIQKGLNPSRSYIPPVQVNEPMRSIGVGKIVLSKSSKFSVGQSVTGIFSWAEYTIVHETKVFNVIDESKGLPMPLYLGPLGLTGLTAYFGLKGIGKLKKGQTIIISAASGATGSMAVQIAKHLIGASKVIGISGSAEKAKWVESLGADKCFDYTQPDFQEKLSEYIGEDYIDVYFDNVGGEILSFILSKIKKYGRIIACGAISGYNNKEKMKVDNWSEIIMNSLTVQGFVCADFRTEFPAAIAEIVEGMKTGKVKAAEGVSVRDISNEDDKLKKIPEIWSSLFGTSKPNGKLVTKLV